MGLSVAEIFLLLAPIAFGSGDIARTADNDRSGVTIEEVIVTGSNIPTSEEVGANPVDTYRTEDITRLGVRTATDFIQKLPAVSGASINENNTNGGDGRAEIREQDPDVNYAAPTPRPMPKKKAATSSRK